MVILKRNDSTYLQVWGEDRGPIRMNASRSPGALGDNEFEEIVNIRVRGTYVKSRGGTERLTSSVVLAGTPLGLDSVTLEGTPYLFLAIGAASVGRIYYSTDNGANWTEVTASSGKHGDTRFSSATAKVTFVAVSDFRDGNDYVVCMNGVDAPRVWTPGGTMAKHEQISLPMNGRGFKATATLGAFFQPSNYNYTSYTNSGANFTGVDSGTSTTDNYMVITRNTTVTASPTVLITFSGGTTSIVPQGGRQVIMVGDTNNFAWLNYVKIEAYDGSSYYTLWDPTSSTYDKYVEVPMAGSSNRFLWAFSLDPYANDSGSTISSISGVRLTWVGSAPSASVTINLYALGVSGLVQGGADYRISYMNSGSRAESQSKVPEIKTDKIGAVGGAPWGGEVLPLSPYVYYNYDISFPMVTTTVMQKGVDKLNVYRRDIGETQYTLSQSVSLASYSGSWSATYTVDTIGTWEDDNTLAEKLPYAGWIAPGDENAQIPIGQAGVFSGSRLFVIGPGLSGSQQAAVYYSSRRFPFRHTTGSVNFSDADNPGSCILPGETVKALKVGISSLLGRSSIFAYTDKSVWKIEGGTAFDLARPSRVASIGTIAPFSVCDWLGTQFFYDTEGQIRILSFGSAGEISRDQIDTLLAQIPAARRDDVSIAALNDILYVAYTPSGGSTNTKILAFDLSMRSWVLDELPGIDAGVLCSHWDSTNNRRRLIALASTGHVYELDSPTYTTDLGDNISARLKTKRYRDNGNQFALLRHLMHTDDASAGTCSIECAYKPDNNTTTCTLDLDSATGDSWVVSDIPTSGGLGIAVQATASMDVPAGVKIYEWLAEIEPRSKRSSFAG